MYQMADALQTGSTKVFLRFDYGSSSSTTNPSFKFQVGTGTDGAGTLTGFVGTSRTFPNFTRASSTTQFQAYAQGSTSSLILYFPAADSPSQRALIAIERTKDTSGADTSTGVTYVFMDNNGTGTNGSSCEYLQQTIHFVAGLAPAINNQSSNVANMAPILRTGNLTDAFNGSTPVSPLFPMYGIIGNPMLVLAVVDLNDIGQHATFTATMYSATHTWLVTKLLNNLFDGNGNSIQRSSWCMLYE
jgi:hypothetical protein